MIIKYTKKDIIKIICLIWIPCLIFIISGIVKKQIHIIISGVVFGVFCGATSIITLVQIVKLCEKRTEKLRQEISKDRKIICEGPATDKTDKSAGGWMFLSEAAVEFYPYNTDGKCESMAILLDDITGMKSKGNRLIINTKSREYSFTVYNAHLWEEMIKKEL